MSESDAASQDSPSAESKGTDPNRPPDAQMVELFTRHQRSLFLYILSQVPLAADAEEILQETNIVILQKFSQFTPGTSFFAWTSQIARFEVLRHREKQAGERRLFSNDFIDMIAAESESTPEEVETRRRILQSCLRKLRRDDRELIQQRYATGQTGKRLAELLGRPANSVYQSIGRIRHMLQECVQRQLGTEAK